VARIYHLTGMFPRLTGSITLPDGTVGVAYTGDVDAVGGSGSYSFSKTTGPTWMSVNASTGAITGTPDATGTAIPVAVLITDTMTGATATVNDTFDVTNPAYTYSAWNPADKSASITLTNSDMTATRNTATANNNAMVRSVKGRAVGAGNGIWKVEFFMDSSPNFDFVGVARSTTALGPISGPGIDTASWGFYSDTGQSFFNSVLTNYGTPFKTSVGGQRRVILVVDCENGRIKLGAEVTTGGSVEWGDGLGGSQPDYATAPWAHTGLTGTIYLAQSLYQGTGTPSQWTLYTDPADFTTPAISGVTDGWPD
jgi:hypothetical protein